VGPLDGVRVLEIAGMGPGPFAAMMLADMGADVIRIDRFAGRRELPDTERRVRGTDPTKYVLHRGRRSLAVDLKEAAAIELVLDLVSRSEVLLEGFRPGVTERLGLGPEECLARNPKLVYGRMTGWGQDGPLASTAGHDINYIALSGALASIAREGERPMPPVNFVGDMGGGGLMLAYGVVCALLSAARTGVGQVVDASIVDGSAALSVMLYGLLAQGRWSQTPGANFVDTGSPYYEVYETSDRRYVAVGAIEPRFYAELLEKLGLEPEDEATQNDRSRWPASKAKFAKIFATRTRDEWTARFEGTDACVTPVLTMAEAASHPHNRAREVFVEAGGIVQPAPAPRFSRTTPELERLPPAPGQHTDEVLRDFGLAEVDIVALREKGIVG
jgi:alpha-methylacyl-CoA racemase